MKTKNEIIYDMCLTYRHDYGLIKLSEYDTCGVTPQEQKNIWDLMKQIYENCIEPLNTPPKENNINRHPVINENGKLAEYMLMVGGKSFRCTCGCNVFHKPDKNNLNIFKCNACETEYESE